MPSTKVLPRPSSALPGFDVLAHVPRWMPLRVAVLSIATLSIVLSVSAILLNTPRDWMVLAEYGNRAGTPDLYIPFADGPYRYSPLYAWLLVPLGWLGPTAWTALHVVAAAAFRNWRITALVLIAYPFWFDAVSGNVLIFVVLAAWWALKGSRAATVAYIALCLLMPRPVMLPVLAWLLWKRPEWRLPFAALLALNLLAVAWTGLADEWWPMLVSAGDMYGHQWNLAPSRIIGIWWVPLGLVLATWLTYKGHLGLASLAVSPYLLPYYMLFAVLEVTHVDEPRAVRSWTEQRAMILRLPRHTAGALAPVVVLVRSGRPRSRSHLED